MNKICPNNAFVMLDSDMQAVYNKEKSVSYPHGGDSGAMAGRDIKRE